MIRILKSTLYEYYFLIFATLRNLQFHRTCLVIGVLTMYTFAAPVGSADSELSRC